MLKRLTAAVLSLTIMFSAVAPAAYALDETEPVQEIQIEEQADMPAVSEETPAAEETEKTVETEETQAENTTPDVQPSAEDSQTVTETTASVTENIAVDSDLPDNDEIFGAYVEQQFYGNAIAVFGTEARERLTATEKAIYDVLKARIVKVAAEGGETDGIEILVEDFFADNPTITAQQLGLEKFEVTDGVVNSVHANLVWEAFKNHYANDFNTHNILIALLHDCPYELYWFDKTDGAGMSISSKMSFDGTNEGLFNAQVAKMYFTFKVEADYQAGNNVTVKGDVASVKTAVENANSIAAEYAGKSDFEKMLGFKNEICNLVDYNHEAAENENMSYGNPWQMIYVFDNDPETKVVCEGYAKAFQYLCDMTEVECYTTKGMMYGGTGAGAHMWNIVPIGNSSFIVDITNSDAGTIGHGGQLFLGGTANGSVESGYVFTIGNTDVKYTYDADEIAMWGSELLTLAADKFNPVPKEIENGTYGENITWTVNDTDYDGKGDKIVIEGSGELADIDEAAPWEAYKTDITEVVIGDGITYIGFNMFGDYASLKAVELPQTVAEIGAYAFNGTAIEEIIIPNGVTEIKANTFSGCDKLHNVVLPQTVTAIGTQAFADCTSLEEIKIPQNVQTIDAEAFWGCTALKSLVYGGSAQNWFDNFSNVVLADKVNVTFEGEKIIYVLNEEGTGYVLAYWGDAAGKIVVAESFRNLPVTEIAEEVFAFNNDITEVVIPENIAAIGINAFNSCKNIKTITLPSTLMSIGSNALAGCNSLETVVFNGDAQDWYDRELYAYVPSRVNIDFKGNGMVFIEFVDQNHEGTGRYGLYHWYNASGAIEIPSSFRGYPVIAIDVNALAGNTDITSVTVAEGIGYIDEAAFAGCTNLKEISLPDSLWRIYDNAFADCGSLEKVYYPSEYNWHNGAAEIYSGNDSLTNAEFEFATDWGYMDINGQYYITGKYNVSEHLVIPAEVVGHKIYGIMGVYENNNYTPAFHNCTEIKKVTVSDGIEVIYYNSFEGCTSIEEIFIPLSFINFASPRGMAKEEYLKEVPRTAKIYVAQGDNTRIKNIFKNYNFVNILDYIPLNDISTKETITAAINAPTALPAVTKVPANAYGTINPVWTAAEGFEEFVEITKDQAGNQLVTVKTLDAIQLTVTDTNSGFSAAVTVNVKLPDGENMQIGLAAGSEEISATGLELGDSRKLSVTSASAGEISADKLVFTSSNPKSLTVDENGEITSVHTSQAATTVTVTASLKNDPAEKAVFKVKVSAKLIKKVPVKIGTAEAVNGYSMEAVQTAENLWTVTVPYEMVKKGALTFEVSGKLDEAAFEAVNAKAPGVSWSTDNKTVAAVKTVSAVEGYKAQITVPKGANGTATVTVTAKDAGKASTAIEIDVRDYTPRLGSNTVTLNTYMEKGAEIKLYKAYDAEIINISEEKTVELKGDDRFFAEYDAEKSAVIISTAETVANNSKGIKLTLAVNTEKGLTEQQITVKVANKLPKVTVKQNGVFNTFCTDSEVFTEVSTKEAQITDIQLKETESFAGEYTAAAEGQASGIKVKWAEDKAGTKADTAAVLEVSFEGYRETAKVKYTVSAKETKPNLVISRTSNVYSYLNMNSEAVTVKDKATGEVKDISTLSWKVTSAEGYAEVTEAEGGLKFTPVLDENNRFADNRTSHTVKFEVQAENWVKAIGFSYKLTVDTAKPSVSTKNGTVVLRTMYADEAEMVFKANKANCPEPVRYEYANAAKAGSSAYEEAEKITFRSEGWKVYAGLETESMPKAGSYSFKVTAVVNNAQGEEVRLNAVTVKVTVSDTKPVVSIKPATVQLDGTKAESGSVTVIPNDSSCPEPVYNITPDTKNASVLAQMEKINISSDGWQITAEFKDINDMPANGSYRYKVTPTISTAAGAEALKPAYFAVKVATPAAAVKVSRTSVTVNPKINESVIIDTTVNAGYTVTGIEKVSVPEGINVSWNDGKIIVSAEGTKTNGTYSCTVKPVVKLNREDAQPVTGKAITVKVTVRSGNAGINTTARGSMDLLFRDKGITYTVTGGSNFNYSADRLTGEFSLKGSYNGTDINELFETVKAEKNSKGQWTVEVKAIEGADIKADTVYKYRIEAKLAEGGTVESKADISVKTKQTGLKLKVIGDTTVYHRHENGVITVGVSSPKDAKIEDIQVLDTRATTVPKGAIEFGEAVANADGSWTVDYEIVRASRLKVNKSYKVAFAVNPEGNATNKAPQILTVTLKVKR